MSTGKRMCSNIVIAMRFKDFQLTTSSTGINTEFKNTSSVIKTMNNFMNIFISPLQQQHHTKPKYITLHILHIHYNKINRIWSALYLNTTSSV